MFFQNIRLSTVVVAMIITLLVLFGGKYLYELYADQDLLQKISEVAPIEEVQIARNEQPPTIYLQLSEVDDLGKVYRQIRKIVDTYLGREYQVVLVDRRTGKLEELFNECQFSVYEAISTGQYQQMYRVVRETAKNSGVDVRISMDSSNIYLQFKDGSGYLYEVIPRWPQLAQGEVILQTK
ncbi:MAG TPA: hypothetical protein DCE07_03065 [Peptococcaceae bacterium]|nr:hypothetical protein [Peptococcaceae bacterium]